MRRVKKFLAFILCLCMVLGSSVMVEAKPSSPKLSNLTFDMDYYYNTYPDLQAAIGYNYRGLYRHYITYGLKEGRSGSAEFNCLAYMNNYEDLRNAFGSKYISYCTHYETYGKAEGRTAISDSSVTATDTAAAATATASVPAVQNGTLLGTYSTNYDAGIARATNVNVAVSRINGVTIQPGAEFSFNATILPRTAENGYVPAPVISGRRYTMGTGGGICQVSSTLYASMLTAGLAATERHPHSLRVGYIPEGMDATISGNKKDLKFVNTFDSAIQIQATTNDNSGTITVNIVKL